jgi:hypothetical protein
MQFKSWLVLHETLCRTYVYMLNKRQGGRGGGIFTQLKGLCNVHFTTLPEFVPIVLDACYCQTIKVLKRCGHWEFLMFHNLMCP